MQEVLPDRAVLLQSCARDLVPPARIELQRPGQTIGVPARGGGDAARGGVRRARERVREGLVLRRRRGGGGGGRGQGGALQPRGGERGEVVPDRGGDLREGFLDLGRVVVRLGLVDFGYSADGEGLAQEEGREEKGRT